MAPPSAVKATGHKLSNFNMIKTFVLRRLTFAYPISATNTCQFSLSFFFCTLFHNNYDMLTPYCLSNWYSVDTYPYQNIHIESSRGEVRCWCVWRSAFWNNISNFRHGPFYPSLVFGVRRDAPPFTRVSIGTAPSRINVHFDPPCM